MAFLVNSPGLVTTGTDNAELFIVQSGGSSASTIVGLDGNDTIQFLEAVASSDKVSVTGGGGADKIQISATLFDESAVFAGGAGGDTITFSGGGGVQGAINLGAGSDLVQAKETVEVATVTFGGGRDSFTASGAVSAAGASILMGSGGDTVTFDAGGQFNGAVIKGGGGADLFSVSALSESATAASILGGAGGDTITFDLLDEKLVVGGGNGSDKITQATGEIQESSQILGGAGADQITIVDISAAAGGNVLVGGGSGKDTIAINTVSGMGLTDTSIVGGGGADSIVLASVLGSVTAGTVFGGAGADSITFSADLADFGAHTGVATQIGIRNFSDSTVSSYDVVNFNVSGGTTTGLELDFVTDGLGTDLAAAGNLINTQVSITGSIVGSFTSTVVDLTARVEAVDGIATTEGMVVVFEDSSNSAAYLFIQGGATDTVVKIQGGTRGSLSGINSVNVISNSAVEIDFIAN